MRTEVKIGLVIGLVVLGLVAVYYAFWGGKKGPEDPGIAAGPEQQRATPAQPGAQSTEPPSITRTGTRSEPAAGTDGSAGAQPSSVGPGTGAYSGEIAAVGEGRRLRGVSIPPSLAALDGSPSAIRGAEGTTPARAAPGRDGSLPALAPPPSISNLSQPGVYVVVAGDNGYMTIAKKVYGSAKYWYLLRDANPTANSNALRIGQELIRPVMPIEVAQPTTPGGVAGGSDRGTPGTVKTLANGDRIYYVSPEDSAGFSGIAKKMYSDGTKFALLVEANKNLDPTRLQIGQAVLVPKETASPPPVAGGRGNTGTPIVAGPGQSVYTVTTEDTSGFSGIARKKYGDARYYLVLQRVNPTVNSRALRPGMKIVYPTDKAAADQIMRQITGSTPTAGATAPRRATAPSTASGTAGGERRFRNID